MSGWTAARGVPRVRENQTTALGRTLINVPST
jgi:hypothetical protein